MVVCSGALLNPSEVYTAEQQNRLKTAEASDATVMIRTEAEVTATEAHDQPAQRPSHGSLELKMREMSLGRPLLLLFRMQHVSTYRAERPTIAMSAYPVESVGQDAWTRSTEYTKASIEHYSEKWLEYPYPAAINVAGNEGGMEYPGIVFCNYESKTAAFMGCDRSRIWTHLVSNDCRI